MSAELEKAVELLKTGGFTFAAVSGDKEITSVQRGVRPLIELYDSNCFLDGFSAADKVIGKAAAFLYVLLRPDSVYADVISRQALEVLKSNNINTSFSVLTDAVRNRDNTGFCPMETAVLDVSDPHEALKLIRLKLNSLSK